MTTRSYSEPPASNPALELTAIRAYGAAVRSSAFRWEAMNNYFTRAISVLCALLILLLTGCATTDSSQKVSEKPWDKQEKWENQKLEATDIFSASWIAVGSLIKWIGDQKETDKTK